MASYNKVILMGNLTRDPQLNTLPSGTQVVEVGLALSRKYKTQDGQEREDVCYVDCRSIGKQAEVIAKWFSKGKPILIEGRLEFDQWQDQAGQKRSKHRIFIERFSFVGQAEQSDAPKASSPAPRQAAPATKTYHTNDEYEAAEAAGGDNIPF